MTQASPTAAAPTTTQPQAKYGGLHIERFFTRPDVHPFDELEWDQRTTQITNDQGHVIFEQKNVEVPKGWSALATSVVVSKYFRGAVDGPDREHSVRQLIERVARTITNWGEKDGYFASPEDAQAFYAELTHLLVNQKSAFNSPVWFNVGIEKHPQCSACFINQVEDSMESILTLAKTEGMLFKYGSGTGTNLSPLRSARERLSSGGKPSGPVSFMRGFDAFANVIKSGGKTRRAAKMVILDADHPDILEFVHCKGAEERKAHSLIDAGYDGSVNGEAYSSVFFQNSNNSVRVSDEFMRAVLDDKEWTTRARTDGRVIDRLRARDVMKAIAEETWFCGDPGMQFDTTINDWHTCSATDKIHASNPCSEYMFLDNTACNLSSLNLMKFRQADGELDIKAFSHACGIMTLAKEIIVGGSKYPTDRIATMSHKFRTLGLGFANLGALLMARGLPYDSDAGRDYAAGITALMCGTAYKMSAVVAEKMGPFEEYHKNRQPMLRVIEKHRASIANIDPKHVPSTILEAARRAWNQALDLGREHGYRNAQVTVIAPTGTIGFMMDCDTTGVEPDIALVKYKKLVGGGVLKIVNQTVPEALERLGYSRPQIADIVRHIDEKETIEGAPHLRPEHLPVFDCAFKAVNGTRFIHYMGHIRMMAAVQPFVSGAISKTVNLPENAVVDEIQTAYIESWKMGIKAVAIYRDNSKRIQPLGTNRSEKAGARKADTPAKPARRRLSDERASITHKFSIAGHDGYLTVGLYDDGSPGEIFVTMAKEGSTISGLMDSFATAVSIALQYGVPAEVLVTKFIHSRYEPQGITNNPNIRFAKSITDYIFRWMALKFLPPDQLPQIDRGTDTSVLEKVEKAVAAVKAAELQAAAVKPAPQNALEKRERHVFINQADAPPCPECGTIMTRYAACYRCDNCGGTSGCS
ncbi:MAG: vitamin B12-dependent ribonucleotide reductase [Candidatus Brocadiae bacterium]|nr:vitamin B12-dependent ribonucleotide reductase [Candidatus Brocadiia bacterium]